MNSATKFFILIILVSFMIGFVVILIRPGHNMPAILQSNAGYYSHINDDTVIKKIEKPIIAAAGTGTDMFSSTDVIHSSGTRRVPYSKTKGTVGSAN